MAERPRPDPILRDSIPTVVSVLDANYVYIDFYCSANQAECLS